MKYRIWWTLTCVVAGLAAVFGATGGDEPDGGAEIVEWNASWGTTGDDRVLLRWQGRESDGDGRQFRVERLNGDEWQLVDELRAAGFSERPLSYELLDDALPRDADGLVYRLTVVDAAGRAATSQTLELAWPGDCAPLYANASPEQLEEQASSEDGARLIVGLEVDWTPEGELEEQARWAQRERIAEVQEELAAELGLSLHEGVLQAFEAIPFAVLDADTSRLAQLSYSCVVRSLELNRIAFPALADTNSLIHAERGWAWDYDGDGATVAVIDTGVETGHPFLAGKTVAEACFSTPQSATFCPGGTTIERGPGTGADCGSQASDCDHGTHVAGIAVGEGSSFSGVGRQADLIAIQASHLSMNCGNDPPPCAPFSAVDLLRSLQEVAALADAGGVGQVAAANMSLGDSSANSTHCDNSSLAMAAAVANLLSRDVAVVVSSGNDSELTAISWPACISTTISVGNSDKMDISAPSSNVARPDLLDFMAPGTGINSAVLGSGFASKNGTSMAAPHVAGAFAAFRSKHPQASVAQIEEIYKETGTQVLVFPLVPWQSGPDTFVPRVNVYRRFDDLAPVKGNQLVYTPGEGIFGLDNQNKLINAFWSTWRWNLRRPITSANPTIVGDLLAVDDIDDGAVFGVTAAGRVIGGQRNQFGQFIFEDLDYNLNAAPAFTESLANGYRMHGLWNVGQAIFGVNNLGQVIMLHRPDNFGNFWTHRWLVSNPGVGSMAARSLIGTRDSAGWGRAFGVNTSGQVVVVESANPSFQFPEVHRLLPGGGAPSINWNSLVALDSNNVFGVDGNDRLVHFTDNGGSWSFTIIQSPWGGNWAGQVNPLSLVAAGTVYGVNELDNVVTLWNGTLVEIPNQGGFDIVPRSLIAFDHGDLYAVDTQSRLIRLWWDSGSWHTQVIQSPWGGNWAGQLDPDSLVAGNSTVYGVNENDKIVTLWNGVLVEVG